MISEYGPLECKRRDAILIKKAKDAVQFIQAERAPYPSGFYVFAELIPMPVRLRFRNVQALQCMMKKGLDPMIISMGVDS